jgi:hypothetical protein
VGFFKTGSPIGVVIQAPGQVPTPSPTPTSTPTPRPTPTPCQANYTITTGTDPIVPGTTDIGSHCDDCVTPLTLPFPVTLYGNTTNIVALDSNGTAQFVTADSQFTSTCLPWASHDFTIFPFWTDQGTTQLSGGSGCSAFPTGCGIFTSTTGTAPNRQFHIEWRSTIFNAGNNHFNYELRLFEGSTTFEIVYGNMVKVANGLQLQVAGVQGNNGAGVFTQDFCLASTDTPPTNVSRTYTLAVCGTPTPTPTPTATATATPTPTVTPTPTPTPVPIRLTAHGYKVNGIDTVDLFWRGATSANIHIFRNGVLIRTVPNIGQFTDSTGRRGRDRFTYTVCEPGTQDCSNHVTVTFGG